MIRKIINFLNTTGIDPIKFLKFIYVFPKILINYLIILLKKKNKKFQFKFFPVVDNDTQQIDYHYFYQDLIVSQKIYSSNPINHLDIGSRVDGFISSLATFRKVDVMDIRDTEIKNKNINFIKSDLMEPINENFISKYYSISCLHALEHFGLTRYGDEFDLDGHIKGLNNITTLLKSNGELYLSIPVGKKNTICYNAHRIFTLKEVINFIKLEYIVKEVIVIDEKNNINYDINYKDFNINFDYGVGIFILNKR
jgi:hypothetical protein